jgi:hypothetical protein
LSREKIKVIAVQAKEEKHLEAGSMDDNQAS